ncbi:MAG TPA: M20 family metallopeptidase [Dehalococcoidales bacterium]|nr:M20 family metallopeptidase [Dehalococcoidales bacterium]
MELAKRIAEEVNKNKDEIIRLTQELVRVPSFSGDAQNLSRIAEIISGEMSRDGFTIQLLEAEEGLTNVVGTFQGSDTAPWILFNGHTDVVPVASDKEWIVEPFSAEIRDERIYGRGACDMKGGLAAMLAAPRIVFNLFPEYKGNIILTATVDEEIGSDKGMKYVVEQGIKADMGIVCEPTELKIVNVSKGLLWLKLMTKGKSAHGAMPEQGVNAIYKMSKILKRLEGYNFKQGRHKVLGKPTVNVGRISGGERPNVVPDSCEAEIDIRYLPNQSHSKVINDLKKLIENVKKKDHQIDAEIDIIRYRSPVEISKEEAVIKTIMKGAKRILGKYPKFRGMLSPGDSAHLVNAGIPSVMFGPGQEQLAHSTNEWIAIDDILTAVKIYAAIMIRNGVN